ncbi:MAG TPA: alpha/beta hydrolase [Chryseolinea sp.]|nr:alpha/beta hydrolase [Chryseolinea sp.]HPM29871.1 alpha/beta hydrolase [Chryseolinea sp.]
MSSLSFKQYGQGKPIILLHGFPMNQNVWNDFAPLLSDTYKVITVDLPGFGKSPLPQLPFTIDQVADSLITWLSSENILGSTVIGHSLGGYVALAMVEKRPELFTGLGLFHSTALADSEEKKESRLKVVDFIAKNGVLAFTSNFIPPLFAHQNHIAIASVRNMAVQSTHDAVLGYTLAMRNRPDRTSLLKKLKIPVLFLAGEVDPGIPVDSILSQSKLCKSAQVHVLKQVAHMGMFEKPEASMLIIRAFVG